MYTSVWRRLVVVAACAFATTVAAAPPALRHQAERTAREQTLFVSALDRDGKPVEGLGAEAFVVREDGVRREILRVSRATEPIDIALLVDNSTAARDQITFLRRGVAAFIARMTPANAVALIGLAERPTIITDYTTDAKRLGDGVGRLFAAPEAGMTLLDAVVEISQGLDRRETPRAVLVPVITDGVEFTNRFSRDVVDQARDARVAVHAVTVGRFAHSLEHGMRERELFLEQGPRATGGQRILLVSPNGIEPALERIARELLGQYKVVYGRPQSLIPPEKIDVESGRPGLTVRGTPARGTQGA